METWYDKERRDEYNDALRLLDDGVGRMIQALQSEGWKASKRGNTWIHPETGEYLKLPEAYRSTRHYARKNND